MPTVSEVLEHAGRFFMGRAPVHEAAARIARALEDLGIPFVIAGGLAVGAHGHVRVTEDVDVLLTPEGLRTFKERWLGRGWVERFPGSRGLRDAMANVKVDVLLTGDYPGDGQPKPVAFPDPRDVAVVGRDGLPYLQLRDLLELKLASGMTAAHRLQDLADVIQLIRRSELPRDLELHPYVRDKYVELWDAAQVEDEY